MDFNFDTGTISNILELDGGGNNITVLGSAGFVVPIGPTLARAPQQGVLRYNTTLSRFEGFDGVDWTQVQTVTNNSPALSNLSTLSGTGMVVQTAPGIFTARSVLGTAANIVVTNGDGIAGDPTINLATAGAAGTYVTATTDAFGRVVSGTTTQSWSTLTATPTTVAGYGITDAMIAGGGVVGWEAGTVAALPVSSVAGRFYFATDTKETYYDTGAGWVLSQGPIIGDIAIASGTNTATLATVNADVGTYGSSTAVPVLTVDGKGRITAVSTVAISSAITLAGDVSGTGTTGGTTTTTLATVNTNVGTFGDAGNVAQVTVNGKGLVTAASAVAITPAAIGAINVNQLGVANGVATLDATGKLTDTQIPAALVGALVYQGTWNAATNTPTLVSGVGTKGQYYKVSTAGSTTIDGHNIWTVGDIIVFNGTTWDAIDGLTTEVTSVFGRVGAVTAVLASTDFANQGATTTVLHGNAAGAPSWGAIDLSTDVTGTLPSTTFPALSGDVSTTAGSVITTLATVNGDVGSFGSATAVPVLTVNAKGLVTAVSTATIPNTIALTGDATASVTTGGSGALTLATVNANVGSFGSATAVPVLTVNDKGLVTAVSTVAISGAITIAGDATGSGTTGGTTTITLNTVNANVGSFGDGTHIPTLVVDGKGLVTAASSTLVTPAAIGAVADAGGAPSIQSGTLAGLPISSTTGAIYITTDGNGFYRYDGAAWSSVGESGLTFTENAVAPVASTVTGANSASIGSGNTVAGANSIATGAGASTFNYGAEVHANGYFTSAGDAQTAKYVLRNITTNATPLALFLDGATAQLLLKPNSAVAYSALIVARSTSTTGNNGAWKIEGLIKRDATTGSTALVGTRSRTILTRPAGWQADVAADTATGALVFNVTGSAGNTVRWVATVTATEVTN